jgi:hypothetical protein
MSSPDHPLARAALREVVDLHAVFEAWLGGTAEGSDALAPRLESALTGDFSMVAPDGGTLSRESVIRELQQARGAKGRHGAFRIEITEPELLLLHPPLVIVRYVETQTTSGVVTRRRSTAVFEAAPGDGPRVQWAALHETWLDRGS